MDGNLKKFENWEIAKFALLALKNLFQEEHWQFNQKVVQITVLCSRGA